MSSKGIVFPILILLACSLALAWTAILESWIILSAILVVIWLISLQWLLKVLKRRDREFETLLLNSRREDYNFSWSKEDNSTFNNLLSLWTKQLRDFKIREERNDAKFSRVLKHLPFNLLLLDAQGTLNYLNEYEQGLPGMRHHLKADDWPRIFPWLEDFLRSEENHKMISLKLDGEKQWWRLQQFDLNLEDSSTLIIISNEQREYEQRENETLEKILHVLTHEIMNSVSPINSLADTLQLNLKLEAQAGDAYRIEEEQYQDLISSAGIIKRRSEGLMSFVERYAKYARLPRLQKTRIPWQELMKEIAGLIEAEMQDLGIHFEIQYLKSSRDLFADRDLMTQVLLNLIRNALENLEDESHAEIKIEIDQGDGYHYISVIDNGPLIEESIEDQIFLPFFSTKKKGSGIGLSLSRKIVMAHGGRLYLRQKSANKSFAIEIPF